MEQPPPYLFRLWIIGGAGVACVLITGLAMRVAGCSYNEIQWPISVEVMIFSIFLSPLYARIIA
ncbi:hypothetical protein F4805DRAFT_414083 [Annulohypoxylon moriforme]|nr:hypothetical protein F4805DRAFT_414083 [Annulohypoxylon moriforme]